MGRRDRIDVCPGWRPTGSPGRAVLSSGVASPAPSPLTVVFGGNGAGKSAVFDAVCFVLGQVCAVQERIDGTLAKQRANAGVVVRATKSCISVA